MFRVSAVLRRYDADVPPTAPSVLAIDVRRVRTGHNYALLSNPGTHHNPLSAGIAGLLGSVWL